MKKKARSTRSRTPRTSYPRGDVRIRSTTVAEARRLSFEEESTRPTFIDLFAGIGGMRLGFELAGASCVFSSEWDAAACKTYMKNFKGHRPHGDIQKIHASDIPAHDILVAGFPCQPFSIAGVSKKRSLGRPTGFEDLTQGTLFFDVARIIKARRPRAFVLENVKNLRSHDRGNTFRVIMDTLTNDLGYVVPPPAVIDASRVVPQHRERIFIVGFDVCRQFEWPSEEDFEVLRQKRTLGDILEKRVDDRYTLSAALWKYLQDYARKHQSRGNGFGFGLPSRDGITRTLSARYFKDGSEILISQGEGRPPRRLTPKECGRLMGFPDNFELPVSDTQAYKQFGNSVVVPVVQAVAQKVIAAMRVSLGPAAQVGSGPVSASA